MSFLGKISSIINPWAKQDARGDIVRLMDAQLFHVTPVKGKMAKKLVFPKAEAIVRRTGQEFQYQLVVSRSYEAGERELIREAAEKAGDLDALLEDAEEKAFLLDEGMGFNKVVEGTKQRALVTFCWFDMDDVDGWNANPSLRPRYELLVEVNNQDASDGQVNKVNLEEWEQDVWRAMWERKFNKPALENREAVAEWTRQHVMLGAMGPASAPGTPHKQGFHPAPRTPASATSSATSFKTPASSTKSAVFDDAQTNSPTPKPLTKPGTKIHALPPLRTLPPGTVVAEIPAELYQFQAHVSQFILIRHQVKACLLKANAFQYWMVVRSHDDVDLISQEVEERMNPIYSTQDKAFVWCYYDDDDGIYSWALKFAEAAMEEDWRQTFQACLWEVANESPFSKLKEEDRQYVLDGAGQDAEDLDIQMGELDDMLDEIDQFVDAGSKAWDKKVKVPKPVRTTRSTAARPVALSSEDESDTSESETESEPEVEYGNEETEEANRKMRNDSHASTGERNSNLAVGHVSDRTFVVRGNRIGVFKYGEENSLQFVTSINQVLKTQTGGVPQTPPKIMLHGQDKSLLLLDPRDEHRIQKMDLERGEVVETWKVHSDIGVEEIAPDTKFSQQTVEQTLLGLSHNALFRIDPRLSGDKLVMSEMKQYSTKQGFTCTATDAQGHIVVGSSKGEIRMFDSVGKMAKNLLPGFGERIIGIDVTANGEWILATCKDYLLLIHNITKTTSGTATGFTQRMSKESRAQPRKLKILPQHVAFMGGPVNFTPAKFNIGDSDEQTIVTSTGPFVVTWNFRQVKSGRYHVCISTKLTILGLHNQKIQ